MALPAALALIVQDPGMSRVAVLPLTVQTAGVVEAKVTGRPVLAVAARVTEPGATWGAMVGKSMVWLAW